VAVLPYVRLGGRYCRIDPLFFFFFFFSFLFFSFFFFLFSFFFTSYVGAGGVPLSLSRDGPMLRIPSRPTSIVEHIETPSSPAGAASPPSEASKVPARSRGITCVRVYTSGYRYQDIVMSGHMYVCTYVCVRCFFFSFSLFLLLTAILAMDRRIRRKKTILAFLDRTQLAGLSSELRP